MSLYEQLIQEGIEKGLEQGLIRALKTMLHIEMDAFTIAAALELTPEQALTYIGRVNKVNS